jgi:tetratricopeptide (TPR) repeat protein
VVAGADGGNARLAALIAEAGWSHTQTAAAFTRVAGESGADELLGVGRSHVSHWVAGSRPSGRSPSILREALSRRLGRLVTLSEAGLADDPSPGQALNWDADTLTALADLGRANVDAERRRVLSCAAYSVATLTPPSAWWDHFVSRRTSPVGGGGVAGWGDLEAVREMVAAFSRVDQRRGGGHGRTALVQYLTSDVAAYLHGRFTDTNLRDAMFSTAGELAYLCGWMAFDNAEHALAQRYFTLALKLAAEAGDPPLAGHILRAMAHQAVDLGHPRQALGVATASTEGDPYTQACPRERALFGVVHARALAAAGDRQAATRALLRAEDDLAAAAPGDEEPGRVFFFGEASLAHETACALRDSGDLTGSIQEFQRSVRTRKAATFTRTHAVTLGYLGAVHARQGAIDEACNAWSQALETMEGVRSGRARQTVLDMRSVLSSFRGRGIRAVTDVDTRASRYLAHTA